MSLKQKVQDKKAPQEVVFDVPGMGELTFRVRKVGIFQVLEKESDVFSSFARMQGTGEDKEVSGDSIIQGLKINRLFLHLGVEVFDAEEDAWLSFDYEDGDDAFLPEDLLDQETMNKLVGMVAGSFR